MPKCFYLAPLYRWNKLAHGGRCRLSDARWPIARPTPVTAAVALPII